MNTDQYHYRMNQLRREDVMRAARREHLLRLAQERRPKHRREYLAALVTLLHSIAR